MTKLAAVCAYFNPGNYQSRRQNYDDFRRRFDRNGVTLLTVEQIIDADSRSELGPHDNVLGIRGGDVMWQKERLLQIGIDRLLADGFDAVAWVDADIVFEDHPWPARVLRALDQFDVIQPFETLVSRYPGRSLVRPSCVKDRRSFAHGGAWAARADFWRQTPLYQHCILGGADSLMANVLLQMSPHEAVKFQWPENDVILQQMPPRLRMHATQWAEQIDRPLRIGYVPGVTAHLLPHGSRRNRFYLERWRALVDFDPAKDIGVAPSGAFQWTCDKPCLKALVRRYFEVRREDG